MLAGRDVTAVGYPRGGSVRGGGLGYPDPQGPGSAGGGRTRAGNGAQGRRRRARKRAHEGGGRELIGVAHQKHVPL